MLFHFNPDEEKIMANISIVDLRKEIAASTGKTVADVKAILDGLIESIYEHTFAGDKVTINELCIFEVQATKERNYRNPKTGEKIVKPASKRVLIKPAKKLKDTVAMG